MACLSDKIYNFCDNDLFLLDRVAKVAEHLGKSSQRLRYVFLYKPLTHEAKSNYFFHITMPSGKKHCVMYY